MADEQKLPIESMMNEEYWQNPGCFERLREKIAGYETEKLWVE